MLDVARNYHARGWAGVPIPYREKGPKIPNWEKLRISATDLPRYYNGKLQNIGVILGEPSGNLVDIDLDHPVAVELAAEYLPPTGAIFGRTGKRRSHWLYRTTYAVPTKQAKHPEAGMIVELRSTGAQTVFPGSTHPSGEPIEWDQAGEPALVMPSALDEAIGKLLDAFYERTGLERTKPKPPAKRKATRANGGSSVIDRARAYLAEMPAAISGQCGHDRTFDAACALVLGFDLSPSRAAPLLADWNQTCDPPWTDAELRHKLDDADAKDVERGYLNKETKRRETSVTQLVGATGPAAESPDLLKIEGQTDLANARRLQSLHGATIRYCGPSESWLIYSGKHWKLDESHLIERLAKDVVAAIWKQIGDSAGKYPDDLLLGAARFARASASAAGIRNMVIMTRSEVPVLPDQFDLDPWLLNCTNGTIDLRTGSLRPHDKSDYLSKLASVSYDPAATCDTWERFVGDIFAQNERLIGFAQRAAGYTLTGLTSARCLFFLFGKGRNGKTTFVSTLLKLLGNYATTITNELLMVSRTQSHPTEICDLHGVRLAVASETEKGRRFAESLVKQLTGGEDQMKGRGMREDYWTFRPTHKIWICGNSKPDIRGIDDGIWDRIRMVPFGVRFDSPDASLSKRLEDELPGILNWAIRGLLEWQQDGLGEPYEVQAATQVYRGEMDTLAPFLETKCNVGCEYRIKASELYQAYLDWCREINERDPMNQTLFGRTMSERGFESKKLGGSIYRFGLELPTAQFDFEPGQ